MIHEVDQALTTLVRRDPDIGKEVELALDAPTREWSSRRNAPTIDLFLYDVREDMRRRERGMLNEYDDEGHVSARTLPPRHFVLSYLVTAWTNRPADEHRLLSAVLGCFLRHDALPADVLEGVLSDIGLPVAVTIALPPPEDRSFADVWSALGGELKPSLDIRVTAPVASPRRFEADTLVREETHLRFQGEDGTPRARRRSHARPRTVPPPAPAAEERTAGKPERPGRILQAREIQP